jgi:hypothetical protein
MDLSVPTSPTSTTSTSSSLHSRADSLEKLSKRTSDIAPRSKKPEEQGTYLSSLTQWVTESWREPYKHPEPLSKFPADGMLYLSEVTPKSRKNGNKSSYRLRFILSVRGPVTVGDVERCTFLTKSDGNLVEMRLFDVAYGLGTQGNNVYRSSLSGRFGGEMMPTEDDIDSGRIFTFGDGPDDVLLLPGAVYVAEAEALDGPFITQGQWLSGVGGR